MSQPRTLGTWESLADLELVIEDYTLEPLMRAAQARAAEDVRLRFSDGVLGARITER